MDISMGVSDGMFCLYWQKKGFSITTTATWAKGIFNEIFILFLLFENLHKKIEIKIKRRELKKKQFFKFFFDFFFLDVNNDWQGKYFSVKF